MFDSPALFIDSIGIYLMPPRFQSHCVNEHLRIQLQMRKSLDPGQICRPVGLGRADFEFAGVGRAFRGETEEKEEKEKNRQRQRLFAKQS